jgi:hypothetical protein
LAPRHHDPELGQEEILQLLEDDQLVWAKEKVHLGRRRFSRGLSVVLWGLRVYVVLMLVLIVVRVVQTVSAGH